MQIILLCPMLEGPSICHHFLLRDFPNVPASIYRISWQHKLLPMKIWQCRGSLEVASLVPNSCICHGSLQDAFTSLANFLWSSFSDTIDSSVHYSGVLHLLAFHGAHQLNSVTGGSGDVSSPSSLEVSSNPLRKEGTIGFSSGSSSKFEPLPLDPCSLGFVWGLAEWFKIGWSSNQTWQHLFICHSLLCYQWTLLLDLAP